jgi:hypothetical protein
MPTSQIVVTSGTFQSLTASSATIQSLTVSTESVKRINVTQAFILTPTLLQATGSNSQANSATFSTPAVVVTRASSPTRGIRLPVATTGLTELVSNAGSNSVHVFPATGARIGSAATNAAVNVGAGKGSIFFAQDAKTWRVIAGA